MSAEGRRFLAAHSLRYLPLVRILVGTVGAAVYWLGALLWPTSIAVVLSLFATALLDARGRDPANWYWIFVLLIRYNTLMALSSATVPIHLPANCTLGLIMIAAQAVSGAMELSVIEGGKVQPDQSTRSAESGARTPLNFGLALALGLAPATLLGVPGLIGLGAAIVARMALVRWRKLPGLQPITETSFCLGALAAWQYV